LSPSDLEGFVNQPLANIEALREIKNLLLQREVLKTWEQELRR